jgi:hypothetical protein
MRIFAALRSWLSTRADWELRVKPHPRDHVGFYAIGCEEQERCALETRPLVEAITEADIVVSEESTGALEALMHGRPLILAHFSGARLANPLHEHGACKLAENADRLHSELERAAGGERAPAEAVRRTVHDYAGVLDGGATARVTDWALELAGVRVP